MKDNITLITLLVLCSTVVFTLVQVFFSLAENIKTKINVILVSQTVSFQCKNDKIVIFETNIENDLNMEKIDGKNDVEQN